MKASLLTLFLAAFALFSISAKAELDLNGSATVNGCSGGFFIMNGMSETQRGLVITNGHCIRLSAISSAKEDFPKPGQSIYDLQTSDLTNQTHITIYSDKGHGTIVKATKLLFATMTETDIAVYEIEPTYQELRSDHHLEPLILDRAPPLDDAALVIHSSYFNRSQSCKFSGRVDLVEGPYSTKAALRLSRDCEIYTGFSGAPLRNSFGRTFFGLANTHRSDPSTTDPAACDLNNPCEIETTSGRLLAPAAGQSYGVSVVELNRCFDLKAKSLNFQYPGCPYRKVASVEYISFGGDQIKALDPLEKSLVVIENKMAHRCSGTFLAKDIVLTAAHCVTPDSKGHAVATVGGSVFPLSLDEGYDPIRGDKLIIESISVHPKKEEMDIWIPIDEENSYPFDNPDLALLKLKTPYENAKLAHLTEKGDPADHRYVYSAGFGKGNESWQRPDRLRFQILPNIFSEVLKDYEDLSESNTHIFMRALGKSYELIAPYFYFVRPDFPGQQTLCYGDSGGPLFVTKASEVSEGEEIQIIGVASMYIPHPNKGNKGCEDSYLNVFAKVGPHLTWLKSEISRLTSQN